MAFTETLGNFYCFMLCSINYPYFKGAVLTDPLLVGPKSAHVIYAHTSVNKLKATMESAIMLYGVILEKA